MTKKQLTHRSLSIWVLITLQFLLGLGAAICGALLIIAPDGHLMQMPVTMLSHTPFATFRLPGILLFTFVGIYPLLVVYSLFARPAWSWPELINPFKTMHWAWAASLAAGVIVIIWICVQMIMLGTVQFLHVLYLVWGAAILLLTLYPTIGQRYLVKSLLPSKDFQENIK